MRRTNFSSAASLSVVHRARLQHAVAGLLASFTMLITCCCSAEAARRTSDWPVLIVIAATIGVGTALQKTGLASLAADRGA